MSKFIRGGLGSVFLIIGAYFVIVPMHMLINKELGMMETVTSMIMGLPIALAGGYLLSKQIAEQTATFVLDKMTKVRDILPIRVGGKRSYDPPPEPEVKP